MKMMEENTMHEVIVELNKFELVAAGSYLNYEQLHRNIAEKINTLIACNFSLLVSLFYRLDIPEKKLKALLNTSGDKPAGDIIATLIIERQLQKIETRKAFKTNGFCDEEKW